MRHFVLTGLLLALLLVPAGAARPATRVEAGSGISDVLPTGWRFIHRQLSDCSDPVQRFAVASRGATVLVLETSSGPFPARQAPFSPSGAPVDLRGLLRHAHRARRCAALPRPPPQ